MFRRRMGLMVGVALVMAGAAGAAESAGAAGAAGGNGAAEPELPHLVGPRRVDLGDGIEIDLPAGMVLYERAQARAIFESWGDPTEGVIGLVSRPDRTWSVAIGYVPVGYVTDSDADKLDPDEMLEMYREGTTRQNAKRRVRGVPELVIDGWSELPRYEHARHHLVWGLRTHNTEGQGINIFTNILGRGGYLVLGLIDDPSTIEQSKLEAAALIDATRFQPGSRYEDYREGDKTSGMGLRMLVLGGAGVAVAKAAKTGILAAILLVLKKGFVVIGAAIAGMFKWLTGRKSRPSAEPVAAGDPGAGAGPDVG
jgi:uncharacterized membrane-anchored protein